MEQIIENLLHFWESLLQFWEKLVEASQNPWVIFGFTAQAFFFMRFLVQWIASEREGRSVVPVAFWWFSIGGASGLLIYAVHKQDPVFIFGQSLGFIIYTRNLVLIRKERLAASSSQSADSPPQGAEFPPQGAVSPPQGVVPPPQGVVPPPGTVPSQNAPITAARAAQVADAK